MTNRNPLLFVFIFIFILNVTNFVLGVENHRFFFTTEENNLIKVNDGSLTDIEGKDWVAKAFYKEDINKTGFAYLEIETNKNESNSKQALHAGYIEGSVSSKLIYSQWFNNIRDFCIGKEQKCSEMQNFIKNNTLWVASQWEEYKDDPYWHQVMLFYTQVSGVYLGYNNHTNNHLDYYAILWLNIFYDLGDLYTALGGEQIIGDGSCSVLIKVLEGNADIFVGHNTWLPYQTMLRIQKKYILPYKKTNNIDEIIAGAEMTLTSYPGIITSQDDFYLISSGLVATETTNQIFNKTLWQYVIPDKIVFQSVRMMTSNRLAVDGQSWNDIFKLYNSGTYNNQWMILDYNKFKPGHILPNGTLWVSEQIPSMIIAKDLTSVLNTVGYWSSYNIPYFDDIFEISGYAKMLQKYGSWFSHEEAPRPSIFRREEGNVHDMASFMDLMRSNDFKNEPFALCNCTPPYSASGAIAARDDLNVENGTYQIRVQSRRPNGATDAKITNQMLFVKKQFMAVAGPTTGTNNKLPVFKWSTSNFPDTPHLSHPDEWNFKPVLHKWKLEY